MAPDPEVTLKELMETRFDALEDKVETRFNSTDKKVDNLEERVKVLEGVISNDVKHAIRLWRYIGSLVVGILMILLAAYLKQRLGL